MQPFRLSNLVVLAALVCTGAAIKCFDGLEGNNISTDCSGSCVRSTVTHEGKKFVELSCHPTLEKEGCRDRMIDGLKDEVCFCNTDHCNTSPSTTTTTTTTTAPPTITSTTEGAAIKCYDGLEGNHISVDCLGSCLRSTVTREGNQLIELSCHPTLEEEGCRYRTIGGIPDEVCFCNSNYCNSFPTTSSPATTTTTTATPTKTSPSTTDSPTTAAAPTTASPATTTTEGTTIKCYVGFLGTEKTTDCQGSCTRTTDRGTSKTLLGCSLKKLSRGCDDVKVHGKDMEVCFCNSDYCNAVPHSSSSTSFPSLLLLIPLLFSFVMPRVF